MAEMKSRKLSLGFPENQLHYYKLRAISYQLVLLLSKN